MRQVALILTVAVLIGCTTTKQIDATWSDQGVTTAVTEIGSRGGGVITYRPPADTTSSLKWANTMWVEDFFTVAADSIRLENSPIRSLTRNQVISVGWVEPGRDPLEGMKQGALIGGGAGLVGGLLIGLSATRECDPDVWLDLFCEANAGEVALVTLVSGASGALVYGLLGAAIGAKKRTVYRFRPGTPQQMSVVIGVGPTVEPYSSYTRR